MKKLKGAGSPKIIGAVNRGIREGDNSILAKGAGSDLTYQNTRVESNDVAALTISQSDGYFSKDAASPQNLVINYAERDLPIRTHIPLTLGLYRRLICPRW